MSATIAMVLAGGCGRRFGTDIPKQFYMVGDKPVLWHTLNRINNHPMIDRIVVVGNTDWMNQVNTIAREFNKVDSVVGGGATRGDSIRDGIASIHDKNARVIIIDGVRPLVSNDVIRNGLNLLHYSDAVLTVMSATEDALIHGKFIGRDDISFISSPDFVWLAVLRDGYGHGNVVQNCVIQQILPYARKIELTQSNRDNIKITYPHDIYQMKRILKIP